MKWKTRYFVLHGFQLDYYESVSRDICRAYFPLLNPGYSAEVNKQAPSVSKARR